ncbi:DUF1534 domain-containing protein [Pseudomonas syringae UB303]|uniref:DUF1534 domain-containing protein n=1 Tax=Pseudomonas syringae UB303 TaxID=1357287 RepID=A0AAJ4E6P9_PSESX|nr:DUF1534 domain-containing protein [Pseudomonas syringae UB303]
MGTIVFLQTPIVPHAPRGNAVRDALRHKSAPRRSSQDRTRSMGTIVFPSTGGRNQSASLQRHLSPFRTHPHQVHRDGFGRRGVAVFIPIGQW